jgi:chromosome segregation ATPase
MIGKTTVHVDQESAKVLEKIAGHLDDLLNSEKATARQLGEEISSALGDTRTLRSELTGLGSKWQIELLPIRELVQPLQGMLGDLSTAQVGLRRELADAGKDWNQALEAVSGTIDLLPETFADLRGRQETALAATQEVLTTVGALQTELMPVPDMVQPLQGMLGDLSTAQADLRSEFAEAGRDWNQALHAVRGTLDLLPETLKDLRGRQETALAATQGVLTTVGALQAGLLPIHELVQPLQGLLGDLSTAQSGLRSEFAGAGRDWNQALRAVRGTLDLLPETFEDLRGRQETALGATQDVLGTVGALQVALTECLRCMHQFKDLSAQRAQDMNGLLGVVGDDVRLLLPSLDSFAEELRHRLAGLQGETTRVAAQAQAAASGHFLALEAAALRQQEIGQVVASVLTGINAVQATLDELGRLRADEQVRAEEQLGGVCAEVADLGSLTRRTLDAAEVIGTTFQELRTGVQTCLAGLDRAQEASAQIGHNLTMLLESVRMEVRDTRAALTRHEETTAGRVDLLAGRIAALQASADRCLAQQDELLRHVRRPWWKALLG